MAPRRRRHEDDPVRNGDIFQLKDWAGVEGRSNVTTAEHSRIAREFNELLASTKAPVSILKSKRQRDDTQQPVQRKSPKKSPSKPTTPIKGKSKPITPIKTKSPQREKEDTTTPETRTRSGRRSFPALEWWTSQRIAYDAEGSATALLQGSSHDTIGASTKAPKQPLSPAALRPITRRKKKIANTKSPLPAS